MEKPKEGDQNKPVEVPAPEPVESPKEEKPKEEPKEPQTPKAGEEEDKILVPKALIESNTKALKTAETEIVRLKKELKQKEGEGDNLPEDNSELKDRIELLEKEVTTLKSTSVPKEQSDKTLDELATVRKQNEELGAALLHKKTVGKGEGSGGNADELKPEPDKNPLAKTPQEVEILRRRGLDQFGNKISK